MKEPKGRKLLLLVILSLGVLAADAAWKVWLSSPKNDWDWTDPENFDYNGVPAAGDTINIPAGKSVRILSSDAASLAIVTNAATRIQLNNAGAKVFFEVGEGLDLTNYGGFCTAWGGVEADIDNGSLVKTGSGRLTLVYPGTGSSYDYWFYTTLRAAEGELCLCLPEHFRHTGVLAADAGAELVISSPYYLDARGLEGDGRISRTERGTISLDPQNTPVHYTFVGVLGENVALDIQTRQDFTGVNSLSYANPTVHGNRGREKAGAYTGIARFGTPGEPSSIGTNATILLGNTGGGLMYLGSSERTTKGLYVTGKGESPGSTLSFLDGGPNGGLDFAGQVVFCSWYGKWYEFVLNGDHTNACVLSGLIRTDDANRNAAYFAKDGTGTWKLSGEKRNISGIAVRNGTLQFDSIAERGTQSALGTADILTAEGSGASVASVDYAYKLGATNAAGVANATALLEYVGETPAQVTTRPAVLAARGGFKSSSASFDFTGVKALDAGAKTLLLDGDTVVNTIRGVTDGPGQVGIEKNGSGTWILDGTNTFTGPVAVNAGRLVLAAPYKDYSWYRLNIKSIMGTAFTGGGDTFTLAYLALFDKDGEPITDGVTNAVSYLEKSGTQAEYKERMKAASSLEPGKAAYQPRVEARLETDPQVNDPYLAFIYNYQPAGGIVMQDEYWSQMAPDPNGESTWCRFVFRPAVGAKPATSYDFIRLGGKETYRVTNQIRTWSLDASFDGKTWEEVDATVTNDLVPNYGYYWAISSEKVDFAQQSAHTTGKAIAWRSPVCRAVLPTSAESWSVASGATLVNEDTETPLVVSRLVVDAARGIGAFEGCAFAETGVLDVRNIALPEGESELKLTGDFSKSSGFENVRTWTVVMDDASVRKYAVSVEGSSVVIRKKGLVLIFR